MLKKLDNIKWVIFSLKFSQTHFSATLLLFQKWGIFLLDLIFLDKNINIRKLFLRVYSSPNYLASQFARNNNNYARHHDDDEIAG